MPTTENLKDAFAGESQANRKYLAYAKKAEDEGFKQAARLFRAAAESETVHANAMLRLMGAVKLTRDNLQDAIDGEGYEFREMYPKFADEAKAEGNNAAAMIFRFLAEVEEVHHGLYEDALKSVGANSDAAAARVFVCGVCGNTVLGEPPDKCPVCGSPKAAFAEVP